MEWGIAYHDERVQQDLLRFPQGLQVRYDHLTSMMEEFGPNLGMPHTRALGDGLFVLRLKAKEGIGRVFFCTITLPASSTSSKRQISTGVNRKIVMLHSFVKKSQKTPKKELETARRRLSEFRNSQN